MIPAVLPPPRADVPAGRSTPGDGGHFDDALRHAVEGTGSSPSRPDADPAPAGEKPDDGQLARPEQGGSEATGRPRHDEGDDHGQAEDQDQTGDAPAAAGVTGPVVGPDVADGGGPEVPGPEAAGDVAQRATAADGEPLLSDEGGDADTAAVDPGTVPPEAADLADADPTAGDLPTRGPATAEAAASEPSSDGAVPLPGADVDALPTDAEPDLPTDAEPDLPADAEMPPVASSVEDGAGTTEEPAGVSSAVARRGAAPSAAVGGRPAPAVEQTGPPAAAPDAGTTGAQPVTVASSAPTAPATPAAPVGAATPHPPVAQQVVEHVTPLLDGPDGSHDLTIELRPAALGRVQLEVTLERGVLHVQVNADDPASRRLLAQALGDLRAALTDAGITAGHLDVGERRADDRSDRDPGSARRGRDGNDIDPTTTGRTGRTRSPLGVRSAVDVWL